MMIIRALESKMKLLIQKASSNPLRSMNQTIDFIAVTPMQLNNILNDSLSKLKKISTILVGGGPIHAQLENRLKKEGVSVFHSYGMTETASHVALRRVGFNSEKYYQALTGISFETSEAGNLMVHYPRLTEYPIETTDQVKLIDKYTFEWIGRTDFVINSGGIKVHPEEIESKIAKQIENPFFISGIPDEVLGEKVVLIIESLNSKESFDFDFLGKEKPREVFFVEKLIYTEAGKLDRKASRKLILSNIR
jgi:O-succinylbenzoic acid--CoA ligase